MKKYIDFIQRDIWRIRAKNLSSSKSFLLNQLRMILIAVRGFAEDRCQLRASALTFFSLLSIVPVVAMAFGIAKGFGFEKMLEKQIYDKFSGQEEVITRVIEFSNSLLQNTQGGVIAGIGVAILFWTIIKVLGNIENSFNHIWGIKKGRSMARKFSDYLSIMLICPFLLIMSSSVTVLITSQVQMIVEKLSFLGPVGTLILAALKLLPWVVVWILFTFIYCFMPNTTVKLKSGFMGGIIAGSIYQVVQWAYINFQIGASKYGAIYGSFAALPLFLIWLQVSWLIVLFGSEISFAEQNVETYEFEPDCLNVSRSFRRLLTLRVVHACVKVFQNGQPPLTASDLVQRFEIPIRLIRDLLFQLTQAGLLVEVKKDDKEAVAYYPGVDIDQLSIAKVLQVLDDKGSDAIPIVKDEALKKLEQALGAFRQNLVSHDKNVLLKDI